MLPVHVTTFPPGESTCLSGWMIFGIYVLIGTVLGSLGAGTAVNTLLFIGAIVFYFYQKEVREMFKLPSCHFPDPNAPQ